MKAFTSAIIKTRSPAKNSPCVVGTLHTLGGFAAASKLSNNQIDLIEIRLDQLPGFPTPARLKNLHFPKLFTARTPQEGGERNLSTNERRKLLLRALPWASLIDIELRNFKPYHELRREAQSARLPIIASYHNFSKCPPLSLLQEKLHQSRDEGAAIFKAAVQLHKSRDIATLLELLEKARDFPVAVMGMGNLGRASRLLLTAAGSCLVYGWLHRPQVPGQFPAAILRERLKEVCG
ncbi:MAG: type I 3-dehydroquinate dehydratase [Chthoniobacterales bacterium]